MGLPLGTARVAVLQQRFSLQLPEIRPKVTPLIESLVTWHRFLSDKTSELPLSAREKKQTRDVTDKRAFAD
ncbi:hypothetical protein NDU88_008283 [Pleurodeles waltl]|uniref:Uncharacterized protein n=1 Tax=Pleurodeles waltl TaxID=8319 RepID=A0AAV7P0G3_PLEWA|nr:hypothetical protein NDU88_008283 [Pleurodeles waltl]